MPSMSFADSWVLPRGSRIGLLWAVVPASFALLACEAPMAPGVCGAIPEQTITVGESATVSACFEDRDGAGLSYEAWVSDPGVATITEANGSVTATAVSPGSAVVTIVADNQYGLKAQQSFRVMVPNRGPVVLADIEDREVAVGDSVTLDVSSHFSEPDGQTLVYTAESDPAVATASVMGTVLTVAAAAKGARAVKVTASDPGGLTAVLSFMVTVPNQPPLPAEAVDAQTVKVGDTTNVDMSPLFMDPDGDALTYSATASDIAVAEVSIVEGMLSVTAAGKGETTITVTATDTDGLTAAQSFPVTVPNQPPLAVEPIPAQVVTVGDTAAVDLAPFFADPDGDALTFAATAADGGTISVSVMEGRVMLSPVKKGQTTITVTATDTDGVSVTQEFPVTVPNSAPEAVGSIAQGELRVDSVALLNAAPFFTDPDGDALVYAAVTSDPGVATVAVTGAIVTVSAVARGTATVTVTATDTEGSEASQSFAATVPNRAPLPAEAVDAQTVKVGDTTNVDMSPLFMDPDGDALTYSATASDIAVAEVSIAEGMLSVTAAGKGETTITVTATDTDGLTAAQSFPVTVPNQPPLAVEPIPAQVVTVGDTAAVDLTPFFADPDGDALTFAATAADGGTVSVSVMEGRVMLSPVKKGQTTIAVTATDTDGVSVTQEFPVTVPNSAPEAVGSIAQGGLRVDSVALLNAAPFFTDPDGDALVYAT